ncbi:MAG TPA: hypothetical protein VEG60_00305, partial [Candidatus Binatia bacterium]|nr:hypothetical protein [Candidatus Binatia bacterium]
LFLVSTFCHKAVLKETALAIRAEGFEYRIDREKRLFSCLDRAAEIPPHLNKRKQFNLKANDGERPPPTRTVEREQRVQLAAPYRADESGGGSLDRFC